MRSPTLLSAIATLALGALAWTGCTPTREYKPYPAGDAARTMDLGGVKVDLEIAETPGGRAQGLMYRRSMPDDHGMLFIYPKAKVLNFWMKNTYIPLSIAFIDDKGDGKGEIVNIEDMQPHVESPGTISRRPVRLALEMNQGWFAKHGVKNGDVVTLPGWLKEIDAKGDSDE